MKTIRKYFCCGEKCPGLSYRASDSVHPFSCVTGDLNADDLDGSMEEKYGLYVSSDRNFDECEDDEDMHGIDF